MDRLAHRLMDLARGQGYDFADVRLRRSAGTSLLVQDGRVEQASSGTSAGAGIRVLLNGAWGFASVDSLDERALAGALEAAAHGAREAARQARRKVELARPPLVERGPEPQEDYSPREASLEAKAARLLSLEKAGRDALDSGRVVNSVMSFADGEATEHVANSLGTSVTQRVRRASCTATYVARSGKVTESWTEKAAGLTGSELLDSLDPEGFTILAAREAMAQTQAAPPPGGEMPVIFDPSMTGLFVHECLGHSIESDLVMRGHSIMEGRLGERVASERVTIVDDPTLPLSWGGYRYDSEGVPAERVVLLENGILAGYLESLETAGRSGRAPNGHGRSEGTVARPLPRMSNTFIERGPDDFEEMVRGIDRGLLLTHGDSGYAIVERGEFTCEANRGWRIERGRIGEPVRHVSVSGDIMKTLQAIDRVSSDFELRDPGYCSKDGQEVPVDNGGPYVRVASLLVGGSE